MSKKCNHVGIVRFVSKATEINKLEAFLEKTPTIFNRFI